MRTVRTLVASRALIIILPLVLAMTATKAAPPDACFKTNPFRAPVNALVAVDANCSHDDATLTANLQVRWDWDNNGVWDQPVSGYATGKKATHVYASAGTYTINLEVRDGESLTSQVTRTIVIGGDTTFAETRFSGSAVVGEVSLAVDPSNLDRIAVAANYALPFISTDGGASYASSTGAVTGLDPRVAFDSLGALYYANMKQPGLNAVRVFKSLDGGKTYSTAADINVPGQQVTMAGGGTGTICGTVDYPVLGADSNPASPNRDNLYVTVSAGVDPGNGCTAHVVFWRSTDHGASWSGLAFDSNGKANLLPSAPDGTLWLVDRGYPFCGGSTNQDFVKSSDGGVSFTNGCVSTPFGLRQGHMIAIDPANSNNVWMVMVANGASANSIYVARTQDAGATWSDWTRVDDVLAPDTFNKSQPAIAVTSAGGQTRIHVAWVDPRNAPAGSPVADIYYSSSNDGGVTWNPNVNVSPLVASVYFPALGVPGNDYFSLAAAGPRVHIGYATDRDYTGAWGPEGFDVTVTPPGASRPTAPLDPTVVATTVNTLEWSPPASNGNSPLTSVRIYRGTLPGTATLLSTIGGSSTTFTDDTVVPGQTYYYQVSAVNAVGDGTRSREIAPLGPPLGLTGVPSATQVVLSWSPPLSDGGTPVTNYNIYKSTSSGTEVFLTRVGTVTTYTDTVVTEGQLYFYKVRAIAATGEGPFSNEASAGWPSPPLSLVAVGCDGANHLSWQPPAYTGGLPINRYDLYRGTTSGGEVLFTYVEGQTSYSDLQQITNGVTYYYYVTAKNDAQLISAPSNAVSVTPSSTPGPSVPTNITATAGNQRVTLSWSPPASSGAGPVTGYQMLRGVTPCGCDTQEPPLGNVLTWQHTGLTNGVTYYYHVGAMNMCTASPWSAVVSATPTAPPDLYFVCPATTTTSGTTTNCSAMQSSSDADAAATLAETKVSGKWRFDQTYNSSGVGPAGSTHTLSVRGRVVASGAEVLNVQVFNFATSTWATRITFLTSDTTLTLKTYDLTTNEWSNGSPRIRFLHAADDSSQSSWLIAYAKVVTN